MAEAADIIHATLADGRKSELAAKLTTKVLEALEAAGFSVLPRDADSAMPIALLDVAAERRRQVEAEGWTAERDDTYQDGALAMAGAAYALSAAGPAAKVLTQLMQGGMAFGTGAIELARLAWPSSWSRTWWKPAGGRRDLVKACALMVAEIERLDRARAKKQA